MKRRKRSIADALDKLKAFICAGCRRDLWGGLLIPRKGKLYCLKCYRTAGFVPNKSKSKAVKGED